jgi:hypothetical protein
MGDAFDWSYCRSSLWHNRTLRFPIMAADSLNLSTTTPILGRFTSQLSLVPRERSSRLIRL